MSEKEDTKTILREFSDRVTLHSFRYLVEERGIKWFFWLLITTSSFTLCIFLSRSALESYIKRRYYTVFSVDYTNKEMEFPTVTMCLLNTVSQSKLRKFIQTYGYGNFNKKDLLTFDKYFSAVQNFNFTSEVLKESIHPKYNKTSEYLRAYQININDMLHSDNIYLYSVNKSCTFKQKKCNKNNFTETLQWPYKLCYQFNSFVENKTSLKQNKAGPSKGLRLYLDLHSADTKLTELQNQGVDLFIHPYGTNHFLTKYTVHLSLVPGTINLISLQQKKKLHLEPPFSTMCGEKILNVLSKVPYSKSSCIVDCLLQMAYKRCGCLGFEFERMINDSFIVCDATRNFENSHCYTSFMAKSIEKTTECEKRCALECKQIINDVKFSHTFLEPFIYENDFNDLWCYKKWGDEIWSDCLAESAKFIRKNFIGIDIHFDNMLLSTETLTPSTTVQSLLGAIGGSIGLCLGFSIITAFEFVMFLFELCQLQFKKIVLTNIFNSITKNVQK